MKTIFIFSSEDARVSKYEISQIGDEIEFVFMPSKMHFFDKDTEVNLLEV